MAIEYPPYEPDVVNQTVEWKGYTFRGDPGKGWHTSWKSGTTEGAGFAFDFEAEVEKAYEKLKPYYEKMLKLAKGDVDLAKRMIEFEYKQGLRESKSEYEMSMRAEALTVPAEWEALTTGMGKRGIIGAATRAEIEAGTAGGLVGQEAGKLKETQEIRKEAIRRALEEKAVPRLEKAKEFGLEREERGLTREEQELARQHEREAGEMAGLKFGRVSTVSQMEEARRMAQRQEQLAKEQMAWQQKMYETYGYS